MTTKLCTKCDTTKSVEEFSKNKARKDGLASMCKECWKAYYKSYYKGSKEQGRLKIQRENKRRILQQIVQETKDVPCADCGVSYPHYVMDMDHRERESKSFNIADGVRANVTTEAMRLELAKCDVVCSNCHRIRTYEGKHHTRVR